MVRAIVGLTAALRAFNNIYSILTNLNFEIEERGQILSDKMWGIKYIEYDN